jgi:hypothetical protein
MQLKDSTATLAKQNNEKRKLMLLRESKRTEFNIAKETLHTHK